MKYRPYTIADFEAKRQCFHIWRDEVTPVEITHVARLPEANQVWFKYPNGYMSMRNIDSLFVEV